MTHLMSLDECELNNENINSGTGRPSMAQNPRSPQSQQKYDGQRVNGNNGILINQMSQQERLDNDSMQMIANGL